jgi:taurine dioxygenase
LTRSLTIRPMPVGAEVFGLSPGEEKEPAVKSVLYDSWLFHGVLLFKNIESAEHHLSISRVFGELELHPLEYMRADYEPLFMELGGQKKRARALVYDETDVRVARIPWHRDTAYTPDICKGAMLRMLEVPSSDGETMFADTALAYDDLPEQIKQMLENLEYTTSLHPMEQTGPGALWKTVRAATVEEDPQEPSNSPPEQDGPIVVHPALMIHPESGRKCIFLSPKDALYFVGMETIESDKLLRFLADHMTNPRYVYKHKWAVNDALLWDNRRIMHAALGYKIGQRRSAVRTTLAGALRTGRYLDNSPATDAPSMVTKRDA